VPSKKRDDEVLNLIRKCELRLEKDPRDADAWFSKGLALAKLKKYDDAIYCFNKVTVIQVDYPSVWRLKAKIYEIIGNDEMHEACMDIAGPLEYGKRIVPSRGTTGLKIY
jgi:tetratricopeptide (TPR) repeat protein